MSLPNEIVEMILMHSTENTRNAFRACSKAAKQIVDKRCRLNSVYNFTIRNFNFSTLKDDQYFYLDNDPVLRESETVEQNLNEFLNALKSIDYIKQLSILISTPKPLKLINPCKNNQLLRVESVSFCEESYHQIRNVLSQIEPVYLREVIMYSDGGNCAIYDMQQIIHAEKVQCFGLSSIRKDQLMNLNARYVEFRKPKFSLRRYIQKCTQETCTELPMFKFHGKKVYSELKKLVPFLSNSKEVLLKTSHPSLKLRLILQKRIYQPKYSVVGCIQYDSEWTASIFSRFYTLIPRRLEVLNIWCSEGFSSISIKRKNHEAYIYEFKSFEMAQQKVREILEVTDYIEQFYIRFLNPMESMTWEQRKTKIIVESLELRGKTSEKSFHNLLLEIDPIYLKKIIVEVEAKNSPIIDMPHVRNAAHVELRGGLSLRDDQLMMMSARYFQSSESQSLTTSGILQLITKLIQTSNDKKYVFKLDDVSADIKRKLSCGIDSSSPITTINTKTRNIILTEFWCYLIEVDRFPDGIVITRCSTEKYYSTMPDRLTLI